MGTDKQKVNSFDVLKEMSRRNMDIRASRAGDNLIECRKTKLGGQITIGVDAKTCHDVMDIGMGNRNFNALLLVIDMNQYSQVEKELADGRSGEAESGN